MLQDYMQMKALKIVLIVVAFNNNKIYLKSVQHLGVTSSSPQRIMGGQLVLNPLYGVCQVSQLF